MKLKRELLKIFKYYTLSRGVPCESSRPKDSENVVLFGRTSFLTGVIAAQSQQRAIKVSASPKNSEFARLSIFIEFFALFHIVCDRYSSEYAHFTF